MTRSRKAGHRGGDSRGAWMASRHSGSGNLGGSLAFAAAFTVLGGLIFPGSSSAAGNPPYSGSAPGSVTCNVTMKVSFSPPLTDSGGGTNPSSVSASLRNNSCSPSLSSNVVIKRGVLTGSFASSPFACEPSAESGLSSNDEPATFNFEWTGKYFGYWASQGPYGGLANFTPTTVTYSAEDPTSNGSAIDLTLPGASGTSTQSGSFPGTSSAHLATSTPPSAITKECKSREGLKFVTLTASISIGRSVVLYQNAGSIPTDIAVGPDGALWYTNAGGIGQSSIGRITTSGSVTIYTSSLISDASGIAVGPDGALWFTNMTGGEYGTGSIGRISTDGTVTAFNDPTVQYPTGITSGPDGALWFCNSGSLSNEGSIGRITVEGSVSSFTDPTIGHPADITTGPDGALWFTNSASTPGMTSNTGSIGRITTAGVVSDYVDPTIDSPFFITIGPDGALWFTNSGGGPYGVGSVGRVTTAGAVSNFADPYVADPWGITTGPDGSLWIADETSPTGYGIYGDNITSLTTTGTFTIYQEPGLNHPSDLVAGPDGGIWFTNSESNTVGRLQP